MNIKLMLTHLNLHNTIVKKIQWGVIELMMKLQDGLIHHLF
jgi:hypothetical protein